ncbi:MAG: glycosyltransferase family 4 protein [Syntrophaceae bacterium]|nr:glycosyltransferase family 4 protein [Syntrophaceae bacterium]
MKILIVYPKISVFGGAELVVVHLCNHLATQGHSPALLTGAIIPEVRDRIRQAEIIECPPTKRSQNVFEAAYSLWKHVRNICSVFDVINVHNFPAELSAFRCSRPLVWLCNEPEYYLTRERITTFRGILAWHLLMPFEKYVVKRHIDNIVVSDAYNRHRFEEIYGRTPEIIHYGIDADFFSQGDSDAKKRLGWHGKFIILHVGMMTPFKNQLQSLITLNSLRHEIEGLQLVFAGSWEEEYKAAIDRYIREADLADFVHFTGHIGREKLRELYHACDVLLHPIKPQGGWLAPFEAMCAGKPVVVSEELTAASIIRDNGIGIVTADYASAISDIARNRESYNPMGDQAREWVGANLTWESFCSRMLTVLRSAAQKHSP